MGRTKRRGPDLPSVPPPQQHGTLSWLTLSELERTIILPSGHNETRNIPLHELYHIRALSVRDGDVDLGHYRVLASSVLASKGTFADPIIVLPVVTISGSSRKPIFFVLDGHHRVAVARALRWYDITATIMYISLPEAILLAGRKNCGAKRAMTPRERFDLAWRIIQSYPHTPVKDVVEASGTSPRHITNVRRVRNELAFKSLAHNVDYVTTTDTWETARTSSQDASHYSLIAREERFEQVVLYRKLLKIARAFGTPYGDTRTSLSLLQDFMLSMMRGVTTSEWEDFFTAFLVKKRLQQPVAVEEDDLQF